MAGPSIVRAGPSGRRALPWTLPGALPWTFPPGPTGRRVAGPSVALPSGAGPSDLGVPGLDATGGDLRPMAYGRARAGPFAGVPCRRVGGCRAVRVRVAGCPSGSSSGGSGIGLAFVGLPPIDSTNFRNRLTMRVQALKKVGKTGGSAGHPPGFTYQMYIDRTYPHASLEGTLMMYKRTEPGFQGRTFDRFW